MFKLFWDNIHIDKSICYTLKILFSIVFVMCEFTLRLLKNIKKIDSVYLCSLYVARGSERENK